MRFTKLLLAGSLLISSVFGATYKIDQSHSDMGFKIKHMMISNVKGSFSDFTGSFEYDEKTKTLKSLNGEIKVSSINTANEKRDAHLKEKEIFNEKKFPKITFKLTKIKGDKAHGDLTIKGITKKVKLDYDFGGTVKDPWGNERVGFSLEGKIDRRDFDIKWNKALETGGVVVGEKVKLAIEIEGIKNK